jgi:membrane protein DedA with SNARE-associated domain
MIDWIHALVERYGLIAVFLGCVAEGESAAMLAGFFAHQALFLPWQALCTAWAGAFIGDAIFFVVGRRFARHAFVEKLRVRPGFAQAYGMLQAHRDLFVLSNRFLYGLRLVGGIAVGLSDIAVGRFLVLNAISALVWAGLFCTLGYVFGLGAEHLIGDALMRHERLLIGLILAACAALAAWLLARHVRNKSRRDLTRPECRPDRGSAE